jgi:ATP-dependent helicase/nuclease subunit B
VLALSPRSARRPVIQTLALALALRWKPLDPRDLLAFLVHPVSPMSNGLRRKLASIVADRPGMGGNEWNRTVEEHRRRLTQRFATDPAAQRKALKRSEEDLTRWVTVERFDPMAGAPGTELASTCAVIASWAIVKASSEDLPPAMLEQYLQLASHASDLAAILKSLSSVTRAQLELLLEQTIGKGTRCNHTVAEAGQVPRLHTPAALLEPVDTLLWWDFRGTGFSPRTPWTNLEIKQLEQLGVELPSATTWIATESCAALRAVLSVKKHLIFLCPRVIGNELVPQHPLRDRIEALIDGALPAFDLDKYLGDPGAISGPDSVAPRLQTFPRRRLPGIRRWWKLSNGRCLRPRDLEKQNHPKKI